MKSFKISALVAALAFAFAGVAMADTPNVVVTSSVNSNVSGSAGSFSRATNTNQTSTHNAFASSANTSTVTPGSYNWSTGGTAGGAETTAMSIGQTLTAAGGIGFGGASANAAQWGSSTIDVKASSTGTGANNNVEASSNAGVGTQSGISTLDSQKGWSSSNATAENQSQVTSGTTYGVPGSVYAGGSTGANVSGPYPYGPTSTGTDSVYTESGGNGTVNLAANGGILTLTNGQGTFTNVGSFQNGSYSGSTAVTVGGAQ